MSVVVRLTIVVAQRSCTGLSLGNECGMAVAPREMNERVSKMGSLFM